MCSMLDYYCDYAVNVYVCVLCVCSSMQMMRFASQEGGGGGGGDSGPPDSKMEASLFSRNVSESRCVTAISHATAVRWPTTGCVKATTTKKLPRIKQWAVYLCPKYAQRLRGGGAIMLLVCGVAAVVAVAAEVAAGPDLKRTPRR